MQSEIYGNLTENPILNGTKNDVPHTQNSKMVTEVSGLVNKITSPLHIKIDGAAINAGNLKNFNNGCAVDKSKDVLYPLKNKRKRRRGKPKQKSNNTKMYKKTNWKFQVPRYRSTRDGMRSKLARSRSIVPYNTNKFLMEEHMAEVPTALLTPSGRTRDSSFSVDSEDNYFYSLPEDEEEFLTKEFANVYEKARVERLESLTKQQLIEECLQIEDRYGQNGVAQQNNGINSEFLNKIRILEGRILDLNAENFELRRQLEALQDSPNNEEEHMNSNSSEDSESDSSSSSSSSESNAYSLRSRQSSLSGEDSRMESDDTPNVSEQNHIYLQSPPLAPPSLQQHPQQQQHRQNDEQNQIICNGRLTGDSHKSESQPSSPRQQQQLSNAQQQMANNSID